MTAAPSEVSKEPAKGVDIASSINIAGRSFAGRDEVIAHIKAIQASAPDGDSLLRAEDAFFLLHLSSHHPLFTDKVRAPLIGFRYGECPNFKGTKSFLSVHVDGSVSGISWQKSLDVVCPKKGTKRPRVDTEPATQPADATAEEATDSAKRQTKRNPEENKAVLEEADPGATMHHAEVTRRGTVLEVRGLPAETEYAAVRAALEERFGKVQYAEMRRIPGKARSAVPEEWKDDELADMLTATALIRFEDADSAARAASGFVEFGSARVNAFVLSGGAEDAYWKRLQKNLQRKRVGWGEATSHESGFEGKGRGNGHGRGGGRGHPEASSGRGRGRTGRGYPAA